MDILYKLKHIFFFVLYEIKLNIFNFKNFMYKIPQNIRKFIVYIMEKSRDFDARVYSQPLKFVEISRDFNAKIRNRRKLFTLLPHTYICR